MSDTTAIAHGNLTRDALVAELRALRPLFAEEGVTHMVLFGSRARGDNRPDSDVDVVIEVDPGRKFSLLDLVGVVHVVEDNLGLEATVMMRRSLEQDFLNELHRDGVEIF